VKAVSGTEVFIERVLTKESFEGEEERGRWGKFLLAPLGGRRGNRSKKIEPKEEKANLKRKSWDR